MTVATTPSPVSLPARAKLVPISAIN